jgi:dTDP-4-dehydrorhamnose 3,5-epimerase-like enzyme
VSANLPGNCRLHRLEISGDARGSLIALEGGRHVPFDIARVYYIFGTRAGVARGFHAHRQLTQMAVCVSGSCVMTLDDGATRADVVLNRPDLGLEIGSMIWREMRDFSADAVLLVLASAPYDPSDYIQDYDDFLAEVRA